MLSKVCATSWAILLLMMGLIAVCNVSSERIGERLTNIIMTVFLSDFAVFAVSFYFLYIHR